METIIAILWFIGVFSLNTTYTMDEFCTAYDENVTAIQVIEQDETMVEDIMREYDGTVNVIEPMPDEEACPDGFYRKKLGKTLDIPTPKKPEAPKEPEKDPEQK